MKSFGIILVWLAGFLPLSAYDGRHLMIGPLAIPSPRTDLAPGPVIVAVRPEAWKIGEAINGGAGGLPGRVVKAAYLGGYCEYTIAVPQGDQFVVSPDVRTLRATGDSVALTLGNTGIAIIPRE